MTYGVHLIAAVGLSGQIGLRGKVPWHGLAKYAEETVRNIEEFARLTDGGLLIIGSVTAGDMLRRPGSDLGNRKVILWNRRILQTFGGNLAAFLADLKSTHPNRNIWICGGETVYRLFIPYVDWHHISVIPYDGAADTHMPPIIPAWSTLGADDFTNDRMNGDE